VRTLGQRVAANTTYQLAGKAAVLAIAAVSIVVLTRYLGPDDYGRYALALSFMQLFGVLADAGLTTIVVRELSRDRARAHELMANALTLRLVLALATIALAGLVSLLLPYEPDVRTAILIAGVPLLLGSLNSAITAVLQADLRMARAAVADVVGRLAAFAAVLVVVWLDLGFHAAVGAAGVGAAVTLVTTWLLVRKLAPVRMAASAEVWRPLLRTSLPVGLALALNEMYVRADTVIISIYRDFDEVGLYSLAYRVLELTTVLGAAFLTSIFPVIARRAREGRLRESVQVAWDVFVIAGAALAACGAAVAPELIRVAGGPDFADAADPLRVLLVAGAIAFVNGVIGYTLIAVDRQRNALWLNATGLAVNVALNLVLVPAYGIVAAAVVTLFSELLVLAGSLWLARRHLGFVPGAGVVPAALVAAGATAGVLLVLPDTLALLVPVGALLYGGLVYALSPRARELAAAGLGRCAGAATRTRARAGRATAPSGTSKRTRWSRWTARWSSSWPRTPGRLCSTSAAASAATRRRCPSAGSTRAGSTCRRSTSSGRARWAWRRTSTTARGSRTTTTASTPSRCSRCSSTSRTRRRSCARRAEWPAAACS
jgi:O-antigen/teichoic acid export membrane protein